MKKEKIINDKGNSAFFGALLPVDIATLSYIIFSAVYIALGASGLRDMGSHFATRFGIVALIFFLAFIHKKFPNKVVSFARHLYPLAFLGFFYTETSYMKNIVFAGNLDQIFCDLESGLWGCQPSLVFAKNMPQNWFNEVMNLCYFSYYLLTLVLCIVLYIKNRAESYRSIFIVICSFYMYYVIFDFLPVVGPQFHYGVAEGDPPFLFGKIMKFILANAEQPTGAFPSSHVGISVIVAYLAFKFQRRLFYLILPFVTGICFATVYLRAHYLVDVFAGLLTVPLFIYISNFIYEKLQPRNLLTGNNADMR